jgi:hypothetical protein
MPKKSNKVRVKKAKSNSSSSTSRAGAPKDSHSTIDDWIDAGEVAFLQQDATRAIALFTAALDRINSTKGDDSLKSEDPSRLSLQQIQVLEKRAGAKLSLGDQDGARADYLKALSVVGNASSPEMIERKAGLFLYVGQLSEGADALENYQSGIDGLQSALSLLSDATDAKMNRSSDRDDTDRDPVIQLREVRQQLASAYCSVAELYMTDLCFEECAEQQCEESITKALNLCSSTDDTATLPALVDAWQAMSNLRLSQKRGVEAVDYILKVYDSMRVGCRSLAKLVGLKELHDEGDLDSETSPPDETQASELENLEEVQRLPGYEFRCQTAKLLLECSSVLREAADTTSDPGRYNECAQAAIDVLGSLLAENDEVVEIWLLVGEAFMAMGSPNSEMAEQYWMRSKEMLAAIHESLEQQLADANDEEEEDDLQRQLDEVVCQLEDVTTKLEGLEADDEEMDVETNT